MMGQPYAAGHYTMIELQGKRPTQAQAESYWPRCEPRSVSWVTVDTTIRQIESSPKERKGVSAGTIMGCGTRWFWFSAAIFAILVTSPGLCPAQIPTEVGFLAKGQIHVRVQEGGGSPFGRLATVTLRSSSELTNVTTSTSDAGQALFTGLHAGQYTVEVSAPGYRTAQEQATIAADGETENVFVTMVADTGESVVGHFPGNGAVLAPKALKETEKGLQALQAGKLDEAEAHLKRALQVAPGFPDVNYLMGVLWLRRQDLGQARGFLEKAVQFGPKHAPALLALGEVQYLQRDYPGAVASLEQSANLRPTAWRAHWLAGMASYQQGEYAKARDHAQAALLVGQDKTGSAQLLLGEAQAALGEREQALATLERFQREHSNSPQIATAQKLVELLRTPEQSRLNSMEAVTLSKPTTMDRPEAIRNLSLPAIAPVTETNWAPPDVDETRPMIDPGAGCALDEVIQSAGSRVADLVKNVDRFTATEEMEHESLSPLGVQISRESRTFNYLVAIRQIGARELDVQEYRNGSVSIQHFPAHLGTIGLPVLALVFHPFYQDEYELACEGRGQWRGKPVWVVHFRQRGNQMNEMRVYHVGGMSFPVRLKGRAWIDVESFQIVAMEADMLTPVREIRLLRDHQLIEYGPVEFRKSKTPLWLPKSADWYCNLGGQRYHRRHNFSHFLLFSVEDSQEIGQPKEEQR
jgi:tetratricopeptide (TPR) repeat protein